jgi:predicted esterase YcpF (UPF0227 family)
MLFLYIHGFNSSPLSFKAQYFSQFITTKYTDDQCYIPSLSVFPLVAIRQLSTFIEQHLGQSNVALIGSSLGGFYATFLSQKYDLPAVLINPVVSPHNLLINYLGKNENYYTEQKYELTYEHVKQLESLTVKSPTFPEKLMVLLQKGDDILDYHLAI